MSYTIECDRCGKTMYADSRSKEGDYHNLSINYGKKNVHLCRKCFDIFMQSILHMEWNEDEQQYIEVR